MLGTFKELSLTYDPVNSYNTFTSGDVINGRVTLEVTKEVKIDSLYVKCTGDANVQWSEEDHKQRPRRYTAHDRYFKLKQYFIQDPSKKGKEDKDAIISEGETYNNVVKPGRHVYPFSLQVPQGSFPAPFHGSYGSVKYILEVTVDRSWKMDQTVAQEIKFVPKFNSADTDLMNPQSGTIDKKMKLFTSGTASVRASINKMGFVPGEPIKISSDIDNSSSRDLKLTYSLEQKQTFRAQCNTKYSSKNIFKVVGDPIPSGTKQTVNTDLVVPTDLELTIANCRIIIVEYVFKVYLDVPFASDPEIVFPITILPPGATFRPAPVLYPNPEAPPPSYAEIYPNPNQTAPGFSPAPAFNSPPAMGYPNPAVPQQHPAPTAPGMVPTGGGPGYWPNSAMQPEPYPTKTPEKNE